MREKGKVTQVFGYRNNTGNKETLQFAMYSATVMLSLYVFYYYHYLSSAFVLARREDKMYKFMGFTIISIKKTRL